MKNPTTSDCYLGGGGELISFDAQKPEQRIVKRLKTCTDYMNSYYPNWKNFSFDHPVLPSVFVPKYRGSTDPLTSNYGEPPDRHVRGDNAELHLFQLLSDALTPESGIVALRGMNYLSFKNSLGKVLSELGENLSTWSGEFSDFILFDKARGVSLIEIKSIGSEVESSCPSSTDSNLELNLEQADSNAREKMITQVLGKAKVQLEKSSKCVLALLRLLPGDANDWPCVRKMLFVPNLTKNVAENYQNLFDLPEYQIFFAENLSSSDSFLRKYKEICNLDETTESEAGQIILQDLLSLMVCTAVTLTFDASWEVLEKLRMQDVYTGEEKKVMKTTQQVIEIPKSKCHVYLTPEQNEVYRRPDSSFVVLDGSPGSGKTLLMQLKAMELANAGKCIACFCGTVPLSKLYRKFFSGIGYSFTEVPLQCSDSGFRLFLGVPYDCQKPVKRQLLEAAAQFKAKGKIFVASLPWITRKTDDPYDVFISAMIDLLRGFTINQPLYENWRGDRAPNLLLRSLSGFAAVLTTGAGATRASSMHGQNIGIPNSFAGIQNRLLQLVDSVTGKAQGSQSSSQLANAGGRALKCLVGNGLNLLLEKVDKSHIVNDLSKESLAGLQTVLATIAGHSSSVSVFMDECSHHAFQHVASKIDPSNLRVELMWACLAFFGLSFLRRQFFNERFQDFEWIELKTVMRYTKTLFNHYKKIKCFEDMHLGHSCLGAILPDKIEIHGPLFQCVGKLTDAVRKFLDANCKHKTGPKLSKSGWRLDSVGLLLDYWTPFLNSKDDDILQFLKRRLSESLGISIVDVDDDEPESNSGLSSADRLVCFRQLNSLGLEYLAVIVILIKENAGMLDAVSSTDVQPIVGPVIELFFPPIDHPFAVFTPAFTRCNVLLQSIYVTILPGSNLMDDFLD